MMNDTYLTDQTLRTLNEHIARAACFYEYWLELEVLAWTVCPASYMGVNRRRYRNVNFHGERISITALPSGASLEIREPKQPEEMEGQMTFEDWSVAGVFERREYGENI